VAKELGDVFREIREKAGLTQSDLARISGIAANMISRIEAGDRENPQFATVARLARALGASLDYIAGECGLAPKIDRSQKLPNNAKALGDVYAISRDVDRARGRLEGLAESLGGKKPPRKPKS
jgi:transcriptional regulator with XRE-family HTH domain